jgi:Ca-activated chloride channel family protein
MTFGYPYLLLLLLVAPLLALYYRRAVRRDREARDMLAHPASLAHMGIGMPDRRKLLIPAMVIGAAALVSVALARPLGPPSGAGERTAGMDVIVALDISDSMGVQDVPESRLSSAKAFVSKLVSESPDNRYGLVLFSGDAIVSCPLTMDQDAFLTFLSDADFARADIPGTAIGEGILSAATRFKKDELARAVVVITDGENTYGADPVKAAETAKNRGLKVYTVGVGTAEGGRIPAGADFFGNIQYKRDREGRVVNSRLDDAALREIASSGGGMYINASDAGTFKALGNELRAKSGKKVKDPFKDAREYGPYFALAAFCLVLVATAL